MRVEPDREPRLDLAGSSGPTAGRDRSGTRRTPFERKTDVGRTLAAVILGIALFPGATSAQQSADDVAKELRNPTTPLASLTSIMEYRTYGGGPMVD